MHGNYAGWHLTYDAVVNPEHVSDLADPAFLERTMVELVRMLEMELLDKPHMYRVELDPSKLETDDDEGGVTGTAVISTSHISIHTWPMRERFSLDVYSCKPYDREQVEAFLWDRFNVKKRSTHWLTRIWP